MDSSYVHYVGTLRRYTTYTAYVYERYFLAVINFQDFKNNNYLRSVFLF